jgi:ketosteroid isomerase-like protein
MQRVMQRIAMAGLLPRCDCGSGRPRHRGKATIQKLNDEWTAAFDKGDAAAVAAIYAPDAYVLPPGGDMVKGRSAIEVF